MIAIVINSSKVLISSAQYSSNTYVSVHKVGMKQSVNYTPTPKTT